MGVNAVTISVRLDRNDIRLVDREVRRGKFRSRDLAIRAAVKASFDSPAGRLRVKDVLAHAREAMKEYRAGKSRMIRSSTDLL